jgi:apolipoprotein N-acyltransferase
MHLIDSSVVSISGERAAVLICYEQTITWPLLGAMMARPSVLVAMANDYWAGRTSIARFQLTAVRSWAHLLVIPYVVAINN